jgi:hypothetical protein
MFHVEHSVWDLKSRDGDSILCSTWNSGLLKCCRKFFQLVLIQRRRGVLVLHQITSLHSQSDSTYSATSSQASPKI